MKFFRTVSALTAISVTSLAASAGAATDEQHDSHHPAATPTVQATQAQSGITAPGMGNMKSMAGGPSMPDAVDDADDDGPHAVDSGDEVRGRP